MLREFVLLVIFLTTLCNCKILLNLRIYNYQNDGDIKHDGRKCESFHWMNDFCDPMFHICVTSERKCDILSYNRDHIRNAKRVHNVYSTVRALDTMQRSLLVEVKVDDHDRYDAHDHIGLFSSRFFIRNLNKNYGNKMTVTPNNIDVHLYAEIKIRCQENYYGENCDIYCKPKLFNYNCQATNGQKICVLDCGVNGYCDWKNESEQFSCRCNGSWSGELCQFVQYNNCSNLHCNSSCSYTQEYKECSCTNGSYSESCREHTPTTTTIGMDDIPSSQMLHITNIPRKKSSITTARNEYWTKLLRLETTESTITSNGVQGHYTNINKSVNVTSSTIETGEKYPPKDGERKLLKPSVFINNPKNQPSNVPLKNPMGASKSFDVKMQESQQLQTIQPKLTSQNFATTIAIACLSVFLCVCLLALLIVCLRSRKKDKINNEGSDVPPYSQRPLPPIVFQPKPQNNVYQSSAFSQIDKPTTPQFEFDLCTIQSDYHYDKPLIRFSSANHQHESQIYEEPIGSSVENVEKYIADNDSLEYLEPRLSF